MRGRQEDPDLWGDLYDRVLGREAPPRRRRGGTLPPDATGRLLDAAIGILGSMRTFIDVAEDVLEERRARLGDDPGEREPWVRSPQTSHRPAGPARDEGNVRDIPMAGA